MERNIKQSEPLTFVGVLVERIDVARFDDTRTTLDDTCCLLEGAVGEVVTSEVGTGTSASLLSGRVGHLSQEIPGQRECRRNISG